MTNSTPVITSNDGGDTADIYVSENTTGVTSVQATDADEGTTLLYQIAGGLDAAKFSINAVTGALQFIAAPDFEKPTDKNLDRIYEVQVKAWDGAAYDIQSLRVHVTDQAAVTINGTEGIDVIDATHTVGEQPFPGAENDVLNGFGGDDWLDGGAGADAMTGGAGDDTYIVDNTGDTTVELADEGIDLVRASVSYALAANIENLTLTGTGSISGTGNALDNLIVGNTAANTINGGLGADTMAGGAGNDVYVVDNIGDQVIELSGEGTDTIQSSITLTLVDNVENLTLFGNANLNGFGNALNNTITGNAGENILRGLDGNDTLNGGAGADRMVGGAGNDTYYVDNDHDVTAETADQGTDAVISSVTYTLTANIENLTLTGTAAINGTGNALANNISGNIGNNTLTGLGGNDILNGGRGDDVMIGGGGNDTYYVDSAADVVTELANQGTDIINSSITLTLGANVENLTLTGVDAIDGTGNGLNNVIIGNAVSNTLLGLDGNDKLDGGRGADAMLGGIGDDTYVVDNIGDSVAELVDQGNDTVVSSITFTLGDNFENLTLSGAVVADGTGNDLANVITGSSGVNVLSGLGGNDTILGLAGNDTIAGGNGDDAITGGTGADTLSGGFGNDTFIYKAANESGATTASRDTIVDFTAGDKIDLSAIDANASIAGDQAFVMDAGGTFTVSELRLTVVGSDTLVELNLNTTAAPEMAILVLNNTSLTVDDFIL